MTLKLVSTTATRKPRPEFRLPEPWDKTIEAWTRWLRMTGMATRSIKLRRSHLRTLAKRSQTQHPAEVDLPMLVELCGDPKWSNDYRKSIRSSLLGFFDYCVEQKITAYNPAASLPKVSETPPRPRPATDTVWFDLLHKAPKRVRMMALLAGEAGMRRAEVAQCHFDDLLEDIHGFSLIVHGKAGKQRVVPITDSLAQEIKSFCGHGYLFPVHDKRGRVIEGLHLTPEYVGELVGDLMPPGWTMHKLRHRYATRGAGGTGNLLAVKEALGHASVATTQRYVAVSRSEVRRVSEAAYKPTPEQFNDTV
jgi:integrase